MRGLPEARLDALRAAAANGRLGALDDALQRWCASLGYRRLGAAALSLLYQVEALRVVLSNAEALDLTDALKFWELHAAELGGSRAYPELVRPLLQLVCALGSDGGSALEQAAAHEALASATWALRVHAAQTATVPTAALAALLGALSGAIGSRLPTPAVRVSPTARLGRALGALSGARLDSALSAWRVAASAMRWDVASAKGAALSAGKPDSSFDSSSGERVRLRQLELQVRQLRAGNPTSSFNSNVPEAREAPTVREGAARERPGGPLGARGAQAAALLVAGTARAGSRLGLGFGFPATVGLGGGAWAGGGGTGGRVHAGVGGTGGGAGAGQSATGALSPRRSPARPSASADISPPDRTLAEERDGHTHSHTDRQSGQSGQPRQLRLHQSGQSGQPGQSTQLRGRILASPRARRLAATSGYDSAVTDGDMNSTVIDGYRDAQKNRSPSAPSSRRPHAASTARAAKTAGMSLPSSPGLRVSTIGMAAEAARRTRSASVRRPRSSLPDSGKRSSDDESFSAQTYRSANSVRERERENGCELNIYGSSIGGVGFPFGLEGGGGEGGREGRERASFSRPGRRRDAYGAPSLPPSPSPSDDEHGKHQTNCLSIRQTRLHTCTQEFTTPRCCHRRLHTQTTNTVLSKHRKNKLAHMYTRMHHPLRHCHRRHCHQTTKTEDKQVRRFDHYRQNGPGKQALFTTSTVTAVLELPP
ncbi:hypothetical protein T492DRAFT_1144082 [Pavlovales sp. CCMP2436]|nr:hypothetical protein T492DRAFT_1144082 [Pavlovales sp. CCMP2436]